MHPLNSLYVHFPHCRHLCNYCDFYKSIPKTLGDYAEFESYLALSMPMHEKFIHENGYRPGEVESLYMGGGTPSLWGARGVENFLNSLRATGYELFAKDYEWTMEINPGSCSSDDLKSYFDLGLNRASIGTQSMDGRFIKLLDRVHQKEEALSAIEKVSSFTQNFSVDLMLGLPYSQQLGRDIESELNELLSYNPVHLSLYILTVKGNYIHRDHLPNDEWIEREYLQVSQMLRERGYLHYEVSNFAKPGFESSHNNRYWRQGSVGAIGPSATGYLSEARLRYKWPGMNLKIAPELLTAEQVELEKLYLCLRTNEGIPKSYFKDSKSSEVFSLLESRGWVESGAQLRATPRGYLMMDSIMDELFSLSI